MPGMDDEVKPLAMTRKEVAALFGVDDELVRDWQRRARGTTNPCPEPDGTIGDRPIWAWSREQEWRDWYKRRPGRTGRPKGTDAPRDVAVG